MTETLWGRFSRTVEAHPDKPALEHADRELTFAQWRGQAARVGAALQQRGLRHGDRVLLWSEPSIEMAVTLTGVWAAGGIAVFLGPTEPAGRLQHAIERVEPFALAVAPECPLPQLDGAPAFLVLPFPELIASSDGELAEVSVQSSDPASIVFTSGSTGKAKGVTQSHGNLIRGCDAVGGYLGLRHDDRLLCPIPWSFDYGYGQLLSTILLGVTHILPTAANPFAICEAITRHRPTVLPGIPSLFTYLLRGVSPFRDTDLSSVRLVTNTGGTIPGPVLDDLLELLGDRRIVLNYGLTETYRTAFLDPRWIRERPDSIGHGIPGVEVAVVREDGSRADPGEIGEIIHRGDYICLGYWNDPEATRRAVRPDPLAPAGPDEPPRALYTGDLGMIDEDGFLYFKGRRDHQLKSMGVRVSVGEVEELLHQSGLVREAAVIGVKHEMIGDEIWAIVVAREGVEKLVPQLKEFAKEQMSAYMTPRRYVVLDELPKTRTGKTDYPLLREQLTAGRAG